MKKRKVLSILLCFMFMFSVLFLHNIPKAQAWSDVPNLAANTWDAISSTFGAIGSMGSWTSDLAVKMYNTMNSVLTTAAKIAALLTVQAITQAIIGDGGGGIVSDWNKYLYTSPQQVAMARMNSFFSTVSAGRLSTLNYEGIGPNYDAYLVAQARQSIMGQPFRTNLQDVVTDPNQMFAGGNMKGLSRYLECPNNPACYTLMTTNQYNIEFSKAQEIAKNQQVNGFLPVMKNGKIMQPAAIAQGALTAIDQLGTQMIMTAKGENGSPDGLMQIAAGAGISVTARTLNYATASPAGQAEIRNRNDKFPFSLSYSSVGGVSVK